MAFVDTVGQVRSDRYLKARKALGDNGRPSDPVDVEIAEDANPLSFVHRPVKAAYGGRHAGQPQGVVRKAMRRLKESPKFPGSVETPTDQ